MYQSTASLPSNTSSSRQGLRGRAAARRGAAVATLLPGNDPQKPVVVGYEKTFKDRFKEEVSTFGGHAYDGLMIAVNAIRRAGTTDKAAGSRRDREQTKGFMGTGGAFNMSATDHMGLDLSAFRMLEIRNGDWTLAK